jgi:acyl-lipid omega-6 desaturase (Delta-12 desaturase)
MSKPLDPAARKSTKPRWHQIVLQFKRPDSKKAFWQIVVTFTLYVFLWCLMILNLGWYHSVWIHLGLLLIAAGILVKIFTIFHDCCHQSYFVSRRMNTIWGHICGILTFTPYESWRRSHGIHHNTVSDLDRRGHGDVWTLTVDEYLAASTLKRLRYRLFRNPLIMFIIGPAYLFLIDYRFPEKGDRRKQINSLLITNTGIAAIILAASLLIGWQNYVLIQVPVMLIAGAAGIWLFYVQHQFEGVYWARHQAWDRTKAALEGASFFKLPRLLQWFSGNIGFHHIHHVSPRIPNYNLEQCHHAAAPWDTTRQINLYDSLRTLKLKLWDEKQNRLVGFDAIKDHGVHA